MPANALNRPLACIILAAGLGTRMKSDLPKPLHKIAGRPMIDHIVALAESLAPEKIVIVTGPGMGAINKRHPCVIQDRPLGTAHALMATRDEMKGFTGDVLVLYGDSPLVTRETLVQMREKLHKEADIAVVVTGFRQQTPNRYGRLVFDANGYLERIVEHVDATEQERALPLLNGGYYALRGDGLFDRLACIDNDNAKGEYYLTDLIGITGKAGLTSVTVEIDALEVMGANSRADLATLERAMQDRLRAALMDQGVTMIAPETVFLSFDTRIGRDSIIEPFVIFGQDVVVGDGVTIKGHCHLEGATVEDGAQIGPFARLRPSAKIGANAHIGNFVEVKNAEVGKGAKANHLTYIGDGVVGEGSNIGAGTIFCNYDGYLKHRTEIGKKVFVGSNCAFVAPVSVGDDSVVGAGSVITRDVPADTIAIVRSEQRHIDGAAKKYHECKAVKKA
ncbi:MAG: bifunctional UDP-N-acetylglucosamine diphosphorylase/glucosamine-1-phosphate N-acetyltransferase GlmU, partial [Pseudomonadota bacterium]|nr:bifunctional UDP-N-acetylglucosamine diphosphorylase/glucosamine-1-phosphate N-acetyltransferase GlmU [Pseudomonadota bacterium]